MAHLTREIAKFQIGEFEERDESLREIDTADHGNIETRLVRCPDAANTLSRFEPTIRKVLAAVPQSETPVLSAAEIAFRLDVLDFARVRTQNVPRTIHAEEEAVL